ncbi:MAG: MoaD/ThiS family protein [Candidatus Anstonellales archaeon]
MAKILMKFKGRITELLKKLKMNREEVVVKVDGKVAPESAELEGNEEVEIVRVVLDV